MSATSASFLAFLLQPLTVLMRQTRQMVHAMEQRTLKNVNNCLNNNIYSYLETSGGLSFNLYLNVVNFF